MKNSFKGNLLIGFGLSLLLLIISSVASFISINNLLSSAQAVNQTNKIISNVDSVISVLKDAETGMRGYLLTGDTIFLQPYNGSYNKAIQLTDNAKSLTKDSIQRGECDLLANIISERLTTLDSLIDNKEKGINASTSDLLSGKFYMDSTRVIVATIQDREHKLLDIRTGNLNRFATYTPILIAVAALLSLIITIVSFVRVVTDFNKRVALQQALEKKDVEITQRLAIIKGIADKISTGDYKTRVSDEGQDVLGSISGSLNKMAESLDYSFTNLSEREWTQTGIAKLNDKMLGEKDLTNLTSTIIDFITEYTNAELGAFYLASNQQTLVLAHGIGLSNKTPSEIIIGEGIAGRSALTRKLMVINNVAETDFVINFSAGSIKPKAILAIPVFYEEKLKGVMELASIQPFNAVVKEFLTIAVYNIGMAIHNARNHQRLEELLHETQAQSEELQAQHGELENVNAELEAQAEKLQASEEELRVQQEELQQSNKELEERSRLLEERNELIIERNIEIQNKAEELALSTKYKSEFLANMSHELRTPLNSILLLSRLLAENHEGNLSSDQTEYATVIQSSGNGLLTLINEILDLSKIESGKMELEYEIVPLQEILNETNSLFEPIAKEKNIEFTSTTQANVPAEIETDRLRLAQILRNLLSNALKFTSRGQVAINVSLEDNALSFAISDTGIGIPKEKQQTIFEAFQQADGSTRRKYGGTGLGLSISRELAKLLGGEIRLVSEEGKGSVFTLIIPAQKTSVIAKPKPIFEVTPEKNFYEDKSAKTFYQDKKYTADVIPLPVADDRTNIQQDDKVILIVEDDTAFARSLLEYARQKGYKGIVAVRGDEGVELANRFKPLGILLDIQLPIKNGWEVMEELKNNPATRPIPVHIMSSHEVKIKSLSQGAVDFINKPVAFEKMGEIFKTIEEALNRHPKKVLIVEENAKHAQALSYFLENFDINAEIKTDVGQGIEALSRSEVDCVILDMGIPAQHSYDTLEEVKKTPGLENLPIIIFTGKNLSNAEEFRIKKYADSIVIKTAHSYKRILDEVSLFLNLVELNNNETLPSSSLQKKMGTLESVLKGKTVLVADDDVRNIFSITKSLEVYGMNVISAIDGKEALKQLNAVGNVDIVLMDMMMPEMDGYESTKRIRQMPKYRALPIIAVTAKAMTGDREKCIAAGASDYITKPVDIDQLISLLRVWLY